MSLEAYGDEGHETVPEGCVSEEAYDELKQERDEATRLLNQALDAMTEMSRFPGSFGKLATMNQAISAIQKHLWENTPRASHGVEWAEVAKELAARPFSAEDFRARFLGEFPKTTMQERISKACDGMEAANTAFKGLREKL